MKREFFFLFILVVFVILAVNFFHLPLFFSVISVTSVAIFLG